MHTPPLSLPPSPECACSVHLPFHYLSLITIHAQPLALSPPVGLFSESSVFDPATGAGTGSDSDTVFQPSISLKERAERFYGWQVRDGMGWDVMGFDIM